MEPITASVLNIIDTQESETSLLDLTEDLLIAIVNFLGPILALRLIVLNKKLHRVWKQCVRHVQTFDRLTRRDISILAKLHKLETLAVSYSSEDDSSTKPSEMPVWRVLVSLTLDLSELKTINLYDVDKGFKAITVAAANPALAARLQHICISDHKHVLDNDDLWGLHGLTALTSLSLACQVAVLHGGLPDDLARQLAALQDLSLSTRNHIYDESLAVFPGSLTNLTSLELYTRGDTVDEHGLINEAEQEEMEEQLVRAVSGLTNLQSLSTSYMPLSAEAQRSALSSLQQLTNLQLGRGYCAEPFMMLSELKQLKYFTAHEHSISDPFGHPSLQHLVVAELNVTPPAPGDSSSATTPPSKIRRLKAVAAADDDSLQHWPLLPELMGFHHRLRPSNGRYLHLAALLCRQASTLQDITLSLPEAGFEEIWPPELPACKTLVVGSTGDAEVSSVCLRLLAMCSMPQLRLLELPVVGSSSRLDVAADLGWLRSLPALEEVVFRVVGEGAGQAGVQVRALMRGSGVRVHIR